ncbi:MAG: gamma-glutamylcyclotransferase family protein [Candidatus Caldarchaeales archaeon]
MNSEGWFFAYGWALDKNLLKKVIGEVSEPERALLRGYRLVFDVFSHSWKGGVANIVEDKEGIVYGAVYRVETEQFSKLDRVVGVPSLFSKRKVIVELVDHRILESITYISTTSRGRWIRPSEQYLSAVLRGLKQLGYGDDVIEEVRRVARGELDKSRKRG